MSHDDDQLVTDYLHRLTAAAGALPADRRAELSEEITAHIADARAPASTAFVDAPPVRNILKRLGDPPTSSRRRQPSLPSAGPRPGRGQVRPAAAGPAPGRLRSRPLFCC